MIRRGPPRPARLARLAGWLPACFYCYCYYYRCCCLRSRGLPVLFVIKMAWVLLASTACHSAKAAAAENSVSPPISAPSRHARGRLWRRLRGLRPLRKRLPNLACWEPDRRNRRCGGFGGGRPPCLASANSRFITESRSRKPPAVAPVCVCVCARAPRAEAHEPFSYAHGRFCAQGSKRGRLLLVVRHLTPLPCERGPKESRCSFLSALQRSAILVYERVT